MNRHFSKEEIQMANGPTKRCSPSPILRKMQIRSIMRYYHILSERLPSTAQGTTGAGRMWKRGNPRALLVEKHPAAATLENSVEIPQEVKNKATQGSSNHMTVYLPKEYENSKSNGCTLMFPAALFTKSQYGSTQGSVDQVINEMKDVYTHTHTHTHTQTHTYTHAQWNIIQP